MQKSLKPTLVRAPYVATLLFLITSCGAPGDIVTPTIVTSRIHPMCLEGCVDPDDDPNPDSAGVWVGDDFSASNCLAGDYDDNDHDGIGDQCEWVLARRFAPVMVFDAYDDVGREPYFAVRPAGDSSVVILYMPAYYIDLGCQTSTLCGTLDDGHLGDSEAIEVTVQWNVNSQHWVLKAGSLSTHSSYRTLVAGTHEYPTGFEYPNETGGRFFVHVSYGKHANYETRYACNYDSSVEDVCNNSASVGDTLFTDIPRNIGSWDYPFKDCVLSIGDPYDNYEECFWTGYPGYNKFFGWAGPNGSGADAYSARLLTFGFIPE